LATQTLAELRAENDAEEAKEAKNEETKTDTIEETATEIESVEVETTKEKTPESESSAEIETEEGEETEVEAFLQTDEPASEGAEAKFTDHDVAAAKRNLRAKLEKRHGSEVEQLKAENEALKRQSAPPPNQMPARPTREKFDYDDDKYDAAVDDWNMQRTQALIQQSQQTQQSTVNQQQQEQQLTIAVDQHYERAAKLSAEHNIAPEAYHKADLAVRNTIESVVPNAGDRITDFLIAKLGEGSEKTFYNIGKNPGKLAILEGKLRSDPNGFDAMIYLTQLNTEMQGVSKRTTLAPKPATQLKGDQSRSGNAQSRKMKEQFDKAHEKNDGQGAYNLKKQAKAKGIDVSNWLK